MQELWAIIRNRGRETANKNPPAGSVKAKGAAAEEENEEDGDEKEKEKEDVRSGSSRSRPKPILATGSGFASDDRKIPPKIVVDGGNSYIEFPNGTHSELCPLKSLVAVSCSLRLCR
jgi:hypothetical protein